MIDLVTGPPGAGKSYYAMREIANAIIEGRFVATNVPLREDFAEYIARRAAIRYVKFWTRRRWRREIRNRVHVSDDLGELLSLRIAPDELREGAGLLVLDEAHNWMNARTWTSRDRAAIVRFFTQHRKLGWDVILIAQRAEMIDAQVRGNFEHHVELRNLKRVRWWGIPIVPFNFFLAVKLWHAASRVVIGRKAYPLWWPRHLYDHMALFAGLKSGSERGVIMLPSSPDERTARRTAREAQADAPPAAPGARPRAAELDHETGSDLVVNDPSA